MREIQLTQNKVSQVDDEDFEWLSERKWCAVRADKTFYAARGFFIGPLIRMQNPIWERYHEPVPEGYTVDHVDNDGLNNQKSNFRLATPSQQVANRGMQKRNTSGYIGVSFHKPTQKHRAYTTVDRKFISLGYFTDPIEAAHVRDRAAIQYHGEFAVLNFPVEAT